LEKLLLPGGLRNQTGYAALALARPIGRQGGGSGGIALSPTTEDVHYLIEQARKCFRLAQLCNDDAIAERLRELGSEFARRAIALGADPRLFPKFD
jgi:hypothetical protein